VNENVCMLDKRNEKLKGKGKEEEKEPVKEKK